MNLWFYVYLLESCNWLLFHNTLNKIGMHAVIKGKSLLLTFTLFLQQKQLFHLGSLSCIIWVLDQIPLLTETYWHGSNCRVSLIQISSNIQRSKPEMGKQYSSRCVGQHLSFLLAADDKTWATLFRPCERLTQCGFFTSTESEHKNI